MADYQGNSDAQILFSMQLTTSVIIGLTVFAIVFYKLNSTFREKFNGWLVLMPKGNAKVVLDSITQLLLALRGTAHMRATLRLLGVKQFILLFAIPVVVGAYFIGNLIITCLVPSSDSIWVTLFICAIRFSLASVLFIVGMLVLIMQGVKPSEFPPHILQLLQEDDVIDSIAELDESKFAQDISLEELRLLNFIERITVDLQDDKDGPPDQKAARKTGVWGMTGGTKYGEQQLGFTSTRYHLAFVGYAAAVVCAKNPVYTGRVKRILSAIIAHMLEEEVWKNVTDYYWPDLGDPFLCEENIMWTGHVLQLCALYEAQTGCDRYSKPGGLVAKRSQIQLSERETSHKDTVYKSSVPELANRIAQSMRDNPSGGVPCEPGLVFFQCNTHPQIALRILEQISSVGSFVNERRRWEQSSLKTMCATTGKAISTGAFRILQKCDQHAEDVTATAPLGHMGSDGWNLTHYYAWALTEKIPQQIWFDISRPILDSFEGVFEKDPARNGTRCNKQEGKISLESDEAASAAPNSCCLNLNIPVSTWASSLLAVVAQTQDEEKYNEIYNWLKKHYLVSLEDNVDYLQESVEWMVGNTGQYLLGVALKSDPNLYRRLVQKPLQLQKEFASMELEVAEWVDFERNPTLADVFMCYYDKEAQCMRLGIYQYSDIDEECSGTHSQKCLRVKFSKMPTQIAPTSVTGLWSYVGKSEGGIDFKFDESTKELTLPMLSEYPSRKGVEKLELKVDFS